MSLVKKATHLYFFGAPTPLDISRHFGVDVEAISISRGSDDYFDDFDEDKDDT